MVLAAKYSDCIDRLVVWGANATVTAQDIELYEKIRVTVFVHSLSLVSASIPIQVFESVCIALAIFL